LLFHAFIVGAFIGNNPRNQDRATPELKLRPPKNGSANTGNLRSHCRRNFRQRAMHAAPS
jgi:hypothetical protein